MADYDEEFPEEMRTGPDVARRCIVLYTIVAAGHGEALQDLTDWLHRERLWDAVSPKEASFLQSTAPTRQQRISATWRVEALFVLLWTLSAVSELPPPTDICDVQLTRRVLPPLLGSVRDFLTSARLRDESEIWEAHEDVFQTHWSIRDAQLHDRPIPGSHNPAVVYERHYALNWLIRWDDQEWDEITTDT